MEDPNLIATLIPADKGKRAENAFRLQHNEKRYLPHTRGVAAGPTISSREATPGVDLSIDDGCEYDSTHQIQLTFGQKPKDPTNEYVRRGLAAARNVLIPETSSRHTFTNVDE